MAQSKRGPGTPWKRTEKDRGYMRRKAAADARAATHVYDPERCKPGCAAKPKSRVMREVIEPQLAVLSDRLNAEFAPDGITVEWGHAEVRRAAKRAVRDFKPAFDALADR